VCRRGQEVTTYNPPLATLIATIENGTAETEYAYNHLKEWELPANDPEIYVIGYSAWCPPKQSEQWTVELRRPEIAECVFKKTLYDEEGDEAGSEVSEKIEYGKSGIVKVKTKDVPDGSFVNVTLSCKTSDFTVVKAAEVKDIEARLPFDANISRQTLAKLKDGDELVYTCTVETADKRAKKEGSKIQVVFTYRMEYIPKPSDNQDNVEFILESTDGEYKQTHNVQSDSVLEDGYATILFTDVLPGKNYSLTYHNRETGENYQRLTDLPFSKLTFGTKGSL
jgi:hypothetical protein